MGSCFNTKQTGNKGEELAKAFLLRKGYSCLASNWRHSRYEIDLVMQDDDMVVFVEVKTRHSTQFEHLEDTVSYRQQQFLIEAADAYMQTQNSDLEVRFDLVGIQLDKPDSILHIEDAIRPSW